MEARVVFGNTVDGMLHQALAGRMTPALKARLKEAGLDADAPVKAGVPYEDWKRWSAIIAAEVFPAASEPERYRQLGRLVVLGIRNTTLGKAMEVVLRLVGPSRALARMNRNFRSSDNFSQATVVDTGPRSLLITVNEVMDQPTYMQGVFEALVEVTGGKDVRVEIDRVSLPEASYRIEWK